MTRVFVNGNIVRIWWIVWMCIVSAWRLLIRCLIKQLPNWGIICRIGNWRCRNWCILHCPFSLTLTDWNIPISSILIQLGLIEKCNVHQTAFFLSNVKPGRYFVGVVWGEPRFKKIDYFRFGNFIFSKSYKIEV